MTQMTPMIVLTPTGKKTMGTVEAGSLPGNAWHSYGMYIHTIEWTCVLGIDGLYFLPTIKMIVSCYT